MRPKTIMDLIQRITFSALAAILLIGVLAPAAYATAADEASFVSLINSERTSRGLNPLAVHGDLVAGARTHTADMIAAGSIFHSGNLGSVTSGWSTLGENVGRGGDVSALHSAFMGSSEHKKNILGDYNYIGTGAERAADGVLYVTVIFMLKGSTATTTTTTQPPATQPPATQPPATQPPATQPPATKPPATKPPATKPPATKAATTLQVTTTAAATTSTLSTTTRVATSSQQTTTTGPIAPTSTTAPLEVSDGGVERGPLLPPQTILGMAIVVLGGGFVALLRRRRRT